jgi:hypothetical protein
MTKNRIIEWTANYMIRSCLQHGMLQRTLIGKQGAHEPGKQDSNIRGKLNITVAAVQAPPC